jgi:hypothetical protein
MVGKKYFMFHPLNLIFFMTFFLLLASGQDKPQWSSSNVGASVDETRYR